jgi:hypothetical protein
MVNASQVCLGMSCMCVMCVYGCKCGIIWVCYLLMWLALCSCISCVVFVHNLRMQSRQGWTLLSGSVACALSAAVGLLSWPRRALQQAVVPVWVHWCNSTHVLMPGGSALIAACYWHVL